MDREEQPRRADRAGEIKKQSYTYKDAGDCRIQADVYQKDRRAGQPALIWIHGGALIAGSRSDIAAYQLHRYLDAGFTVIAINYRLAPETKLAGIIADLQDAFRWAAEEGPGLFSIDPQLIAAIGHSAGGYLALMAGFAASPRPRAVVSFYGYGDIIGPWYSQPDPWYCRQARVPAEAAYAAVGRRALAEHAWEPRGTFYLYCRQQGLWLLEVAGRDPRQEAGWFSQYCPAQNVTGAYPPVLLVHGDQDTDVPYEQSLEMAAALERQHVPHRLLVLPGKGHGFDYAPDAHVDPEITTVFEQVVAFLKVNCG